MSFELHVSPSKSVRVPQDLQSCKGCGVCGSGHGPVNPFKKDSAPAKRCPTGEYFGFLSHTARGRLYLARQIFNGLEVTEDFVDAFGTCTLCGTCDDLCFQPFTRIIRATREKLAYLGFMSDGVRKMTENIMSVHNPYGESYSPFPYQEAQKEGADILYFAGCTSHSTQRTIPEAVVELLEFEGMKVTGIPEVCCGWPLIETGQTDKAKDLAKQNIELIEKTNVRKVVFSCPECLVTFRNFYPELLGKSIGLELMHTSQLIDQLISSGGTKIKQIGDKTLAYHDPCQLGRTLGIYDPPRNLLRRAAGKNLIELPRNQANAWCCGCGFASGVASGTYPEFARWTAREVIEEAQSAGVKAIITASPFCKENLISVRSAGEPEVHELHEFIRTRLK